MATRLAEPLIKPHDLPQQCSSCFAQDSSLRHIDFEAACDRGWYGQDPGTQIAMDDLILCENCIGSAAIQLGWIPGSEWAQEKASLEHRLSEESKRAEKAEGYAERMEDAFRHRPQQLKVSPPRKRGRPSKVAIGQEED